MGGKQIKLLMRHFIPSAALALTAAGFALCTATYTRTIATSESARAAAPLAAPWLLCATATITAAAAAGTSAADAANRKARR